MSRCARCDQEVTSGYVICNRCYKRMEEQVDGSRIINRIGWNSWRKNVRNWGRRPSNCPARCAVRILRGPQWKNC